jgi:exodeoxyribonuclease V alpha subunit
MNGLDDLAPNSRDEPSIDPHHDAGVESRSDPAAERLAEGFAQHVERWARRLQCDEIHLPVLRLAAYETSLATSNGHVCITLESLAATRSSPAGLTPSPPGGGQGWGQVKDLRSSLLSSGLVGTPESPAACPLILDADGRLYLHRYFDYERRLARRLMQAAGAPPRTIDPTARDRLQTLFPPTTHGEVDWQKIAAAMALRNGLTVISGGPGTGKTTTVVNLIACLITQDPHSRIALAAPTGKAAARMTEAIRQRAEHLPEALREKLPTESSTIHRLLGANPGLGRFTHHAGNPLPIDALIVDEASMLDLALATRLLEAVPASARIILLGDKDQLSAVESGAVFAELCADPTLSEACRRDVAAMCGLEAASIVQPAPVQTSALRDAAVWLTKNYRFGADSGIGKLAKYINEGRAEEAIAWLRSAPSHLSTPPPFAPSSPQPFDLSLSKGKKANGAKVDEASLPLFPELDQGQGSPPSVIAASSHPAVTAALSRPSVIAALSRNPGLDDSSVRWLDPSDTNGTPLDAILAGYTPYIDTVLSDPANVDAITRTFGQFRVLCAVRQGPSGVTAVNDHLTRHARQALAAAAEGQGADKRSPWYVGRPVMVLRNDYVHKLFNGDIGIALPDANGELAVFFPDGENGYRAVPIVRMPEHETAFAMTVHKAQGSEFDAVLVWLPQQRSRVVTRELVYTALTRARSHVSVSASAEMLAAAIGSRSRRHSGLLARLGEAAGL